MKQVLLDTHVWVWSLAAEKELSQTALEAISAADAVFVSPISFYEIGQKVRLGKWPEMEIEVHNLTDLLKEQGLASCIHTGNLPACQLKRLAPPRPV